MTDSAYVVVHLYTGQFLTIGNEVIRNHIHRRRHVNTFQVGTTTESAVAHRGDTVRQRHRGEASILKHVVSCTGERCHRRDVDIVQLWTRGKGGIAQTGRSVSQHHLLEFIAVVEHAIRHHLDILRETECRDGVTTLKSIVLQGLDAFWQSNALHGIAVTEGIVADRLQTLAEDNTFDHLIIHKGAIADRLQRGRQYNRCRTLGVVVEGIMVNGLHLGWYVDIYHRIAFAEATVTNKGDTVGQHRSLQFLTIVEGILFQTGNPCRYGNLGDSSSTEGIFANLCHTGRQADIGEF